MLNRHGALIINRRMHMDECPDAMASDENIRVAWCLHDAGLKCQDTNDEAQEVRFHHLDHASQVAALSWNSGQSKQVERISSAAKNFTWTKPRCGHENKTVGFDDTMRFTSRSLRT